MTQLNPHSSGKSLGDNSSQRYFKQTQRQSGIEVVSLHPIDPELLNIKVAPLASKLHKNRTAHTDYIRHTQEEAATLREIVESERLLNLINTSLDYACKYTKRIQELLIILQQTCLCITDLGTKLVAVTPKNKDQQIRGVNLLSSASGSQSPDNTKNGRIQRTPRKAKKNKLDYHLRTVRSSLNKKSVVDTKVISSVTNSMSNVKSDLKFATCKGCLFFDNHDSCVVAYINSVNARRTFTLVGNVCPLTRITTTAIVPPKEPIPIVVQIVPWYLDSGCSKHMIGDRSQLINFVQIFLGTVKFRNDHVAKIMGYGQADSTSSLSSTTVDQDAPSPSKSHTTIEIQSLVIPQEVEEDNLNMEVVHMRNDLLFGVHILEVSSAHSSSAVSPQSVVQLDHPIPPHISKWTKDHPLQNIIPQLSRPVSTWLQLHEQALFCYYDTFLTSVEPKKYKEALTQSCWIEAMQEELNEFERLEMWELVPRPDKVIVITLKWIYKVKLNELGGILKNKARLVAREHSSLSDGCEDGVLNGNLREEVYVSQPDGFVDQDNPNHVYKLKKALYGLKQASRTWYDMLSSFLLSQDFSKGYVDPTLFVRRNENDLLLDSFVALTAFADADHAGCEYGS
nr:hypothetical protein [Tanacetum cinerariifolium]